MIQVLEADQTAGNPFNVQGGTYHVAVVGFAGEVKVQFLDWTAADPTANASWVDTEIVFEGNGVKGVGFVAGRTYRVITSTAGAVVRVDAERRLEIPGLE